MSLSLKKFCGCNNELAVHPAFCTACFDGETSREEIGSVMEGIRAGVYNGGDMLNRAIQLFGNSIGLFYELIEKEQNLALRKELKEHIKPALERLNSIIISATGKEFLDNTRGIPFGSPYYKEQDRLSKGRERATKDIEKMIKSMHKMLS